MKFLNKIDGADKLITDANNRLVTDTDISNWNNKSDKGHKHTKSEITDFPTSLPANGGNADTVDGKHYSDITNYVDSSINDLEIGGRNLILNSDFSQGLTNWTKTNNAINLEIGGGYRGDGLRLVMTTAGTVTPRQLINLELMANDTLTGQVKVKTIQGDFSNMIMRVANQLTIPLVSVKQLDNDWELYTYQVTVSSPITLSNVFGFYNTTGEFIIDEIKLERGNKATDWTPAPEDIQAEIDNKVDKVDGKGLSTEDYTTAEKNKLSGIEAGANKYIHPSTHPASMITESTSRRFVSDAEKASWNNKAEISDIPTKVSQLTNDSGFLTTNDLVPSISTGKSKPTDGSLIWYEEI